MPIRRILLAFAAMLPLPSAVAAQSRELTLLEYHASVPAGWQSRTPSSTSRLAEFTLPQTGEGTGEVVVYFFGPQQGPNVDANLARWKGQFARPDGSPVTETITRDTTGAFPLVFAEYEGTYRRGIGAGMADSVRSGQRLLAAIVPTPKGTMFIQLFGAAARVAAERDVFVRFVKGIR